MNTHTNKSVSSVGTVYIKALDLNPADLDELCDMILIFHIKCPEDGLKSIPTKQN